MAEEVARRTGRDFVPRVVAEAALALDEVGGSRVLGFVEELCERAVRGDLGLAGRGGKDVEFRVEVGVAGDGDGGLGGDGGTGTAEEGG